MLQQITNVHGCIWGDPAYIIMQIKKKNPEKTDEKGRKWNHTMVKHHRKRLLSMSFRSPGGEGIKGYWVGR